MALKDNKLKYSISQINKAGEILRKPTSTEDQLNHALEVMNNFRVCHAYPINTFQATLRTKLNKLKFKYLVSQRLKRAPSIVGKLTREKSRLSKMQDIGGLRAILMNVQEVQELVDLYKSSAFNHKFIKEDDYINNPKNSGYRCHHLIYEYQNHINSDYDGLFIELQIRTKLQHAWATAVETAGTFIKQPLKSSIGPQEILDFFALVGNGFSILEGTPRLERFKNLTDKQVFDKIKTDEKKLDIITQLSSFNIAADAIKTDKKQGGLHLVVLDIENKTVTVKSYPSSSIELASSDYAKEEALASDEIKKQVVLVTSGSIEKLKQAYPSYFLDTEEFIGKLKELIDMGSAFDKKVTRDSKNLT